jgi:hypothetical protein
MLSRRLSDKVWRQRMAKAIFLKYSPFRVLKPAQRLDSQCWSMEREAATARPCRQRAPGAISPKLRSYLHPALSVAPLKAVKEL